MAKYNARYSCGHAEEVQLYGPEKDRQRKLEWYSKSGTCRACYKANQEAERAAQAEAAKQAAGSLGLPAISDGSDKQVAWAERIRSAALASSDNDVDARLGISFGVDVRFWIGKLAQLRGEAAFGTLGLDKDALSARKTAMRDAGTAARRELETQTSARWWIDNRETVNAVVSVAMAKAARIEFVDVLAAIEAGA